MTNVGIVVYTRGEKAGSLDANWSHSVNGTGTGLMTGGPSVGFSGSYKARYFDETGRTKAEFDLIIVKSGDVYNLSYNRNGETLAIGVGTEISGSLVAGYSFA